MSNLSHSSLQWFENRCAGPEHSQGFPFSAHWSLTRLMCAVATWQVALTVELLCRYFPTILIVLLAVFNDGAMIALSKDRVIASPVPNHWDLKSIFIVGEVPACHTHRCTWARM